MALSEYEKQVLADMEHHLRQQDPDLADTMASSLPEAVEDEEPAGQGSLSPRRIAVGSIGATVGLAVVLVGVSIASLAWTIVLGVVGFLLMLGGILYALSPVKPPAGSPGKAAPKDRSERSTREQREARRRARWENRN